MTYEEAMQFWFGRVNFEIKSPQAGDFKLDRMRRLLALLGNPQDRLRIVHIAGSKGKGSTSAMLASILQTQGYRVGLFTSPHLIDVEERIQIDREPIARHELTALLTEIRERSAGFVDELTFFEIGTAVGFLHFVRRRVDFAIVEVGLGGRFDTTNVCTPLVSVITSISYDHTQVLGNTLAQIAFEKAGIIKPGRPVVSGVRNREARAVIQETCGKRGSSLTQLGEDYRYAHQPALIGGDADRPSHVSITTNRRAWPSMAVGLIGEHQARNAAAAVAVAERLMAHGIPIGDSAVARGLADVAWPARLEIVARRPLVVLDCAHNVASAQALVQALDESLPLDGGRRLLIFAANRDKDIGGMLEVMAPKFEGIYLTTFQNNTRCATLDHLTAFEPIVKHPACRTFAHSADAWNAARADARASDLICITGSVFLAGELRPLAGK